MGHRVSKLRLREISSVDRPAQVGAVSVLIKRREPREAELIKVSFAEALKGNLLADKVRDAFYNAFDGMYEGKEAFRKALVDELAAGGDGATASEAYKAWLGTLVDQALGAAKALNAGELAAADLEKSFTDAATDWLEKQEHTMGEIKTKADLTAAIEKAQSAGDKVTVAEVTAIHKAAAALGAEDALPATGVLAKASTTPTLDATTQAAVTRMVKRDALSADSRAHYDGLSTDADRDAFLAKSADEQASVLTKARGDDPVVYTTLDGVDIRKSAGDVALSLAKSNDAMRKDLAKAAAATEDANLTKRAGDDLGNVGGDLVGKKALLKAVDGIADATTREAAVAVLKSANEAGKAVFKKNGSTGAGPAVTSTAPDGGEMGEAETKLDELAKAHASANNVTYEVAYATVVQTSEGSQLYKRFVEGD